MIVGCIGLYGERVEQALVGIKRLRPYVDRYVVITDESVTESQKQQLQAAGCEVYFHPWLDSTVKMRNQYLQKCQHGDWIVVHDPDEWFSESFCKDLRQVLAEAEKDNIRVLLINSHDTWRRLDGKVETGVSTFYKNLIVHYETDAYYEGVGEGEDSKVGWHEVLRMPLGSLTARLPDKYWYEHVKEEHEVWERAMRNAFIAGGGNDRRDSNPSWKPLRAICESLGLETWTKLREYLRKGKIAPQLKEWFWENRFEGFDYDHEEMEGGRWYFEYLHPEEAKFPDGRVWKPVLEVLEGSEVEVMRYVEDVYMKVLHRHADQQGKEAYATAIIQGRLKRELLPLVIQQSQEYQQRFGRPLIPDVIPPAPGIPPQLPGESVRLPVPVNVDVRLTEDLFIEALKRSKIWWQVKPRLDVGAWIEKQLPEERWKELQEWLYSGKDLTLKEFLKLLEDLA